MGDCYSYALAQATRSPLLFKGNDFPLTDIEPVTISVEFVEHLQIHLPGQQQIIELGTQFQELAQPHPRGLRTQVDVGTGMMPAQRPGAVEHHPMDSPMADDPLQQLGGCFLRQPGDAGFARLTLARFRWGSHRLRARRSVARARL
jgi:hypothetical protein